jgi:hypothetical protein
MQWLLALTWLLSISPAQTPVTAVDASAIRVGTPTTIAELDLGRLKGDLRQVGWSPDGEQLYLQTADGGPQSEQLRHYVVPIAGGTPKPTDGAPEWASAYWQVKSDRFAPGLRSLMIEVVQKSEKLKVGTGSGRPGEQAGGAPGSVPTDIEKTAEGQFQQLTRLVVPRRDGQ